MPKPRAPFVARYGARATDVARWLDAFDADALRAWARGLGVETFVGSSGRVFPADMKAAPLLRGWLRRLRQADVRFHMHHRWLGWQAHGTLRFATPDGERVVPADAVVLAMGGGSWPQLGSDGCVGAAAGGGRRRHGAVAAGELRFRDSVERAPDRAIRRRAAEAGGGALDRHAGALRMRARASSCSASTASRAAWSMRSAPTCASRFAARGEALLQLDLAPGYTAGGAGRRLAAPRGKHSIGDWLRRRAGLDAAKCALVFELRRQGHAGRPAALAARIKALPLRLRAPRPLAEAISTAGGVRLEALDER